MATTEHDYYELLGVARDASESEIKKAFRGLARELHPDVSEEPDAEERFRDVVEAYEVLSKSETRELYDRYGHAGLRSGGFQPGHFDFGSLSDLFSAFFGEDVLGGRAWRARGRHVRPGARPPRSAFRARGQRRVLDRRPDDHAGGARRGGDGADARRRRRARLRAGHAAGRDPRSARKGNAGAPGLRPRRSARARQRRRAAAADGRAAQAPRRVRRACRRRDVQARRGPLREDQERVSLRR